MAAESIKIEDARAKLAELATKAYYAQEMAEDGADLSAGITFLQRRGKVIAAIVPASIALAHTNQTPPPTGNPPRDTSP